MSDRDVNRRILDEVDEVSEEAMQEFLKEVLAFERSKMDKRQPHFRGEYNDLIEEFAPIPSEENEEGDVDD